MDILKLLPIEKYGIGKAKTVQELMEEIESGETIISIENQKPIRNIEIAFISIYFGEFQLVEDRQEFSDGRVRKREIKGISEKMLNKNENPLDCAKRAMAEELAIQEGFEIEFVETVLEENESPSYPGLISRYKIHKFKADLSESAYKNEYIEKGKNKKTFFVWQ